MKKKESNVQDTASKKDAPEHEEIKDLLIKNIKWSEAVYNQNKKIQSHLRWMSIAGFLRLFIILIPLIIGIIYLPPLLGEVFSQYQSLLGGGSGLPVDGESMKMLMEQFGNGTNSLDIQELLNTFSRGE